MINFVSGSIDLWYILRNTTANSGTASVDGSINYVSPRGTPTIITSVAVNEKVRQDGNDHHVSSFALAQSSSDENSLDTLVPRGNDTNYKTERKGPLKRFLKTFQFGLLWGQKEEEPRDVNALGTIYEQSTRKKIRMQFFNCLVVIACSFIVIVLTCFTLMTCHSPNQKCYSQLNFQIINGSNVSKDILTAINDVIRMATFLANEYNDDIQMQQQRHHYQHQQPQHLRQNQPTLVEVNGQKFYYNDNFSLLGSNTSSSNQNAADPSLLFKSSAFPFASASASASALTLHENFMVTAKDIETFSVDNFFELGFTGYCRERTARGVHSNKTKTSSYAKKHKACLGGIINGIDLISTLIRDFGAELAKVTSGYQQTNDSDSEKSKNSNKDYENINSKALGDAFVLGYEISLPSIAKIATVSKMDLKKNETVDIEKDGLFNIRQAIFIKNLSRLLPLAVTLEIFLSIILVFQHLFWIMYQVDFFLYSNNIRSPSLAYVPNKFCYKAKVVSSNLLLFGGNMFWKSMVFLSLAVLLVNIFVVAALSVYIGKLHDTLTRRISLAIVYYGEGYYLLVGSLVCSAVAFVFSIVGVFND